MVLVLLVPMVLSGVAQERAIESRVMTNVRAAMAPALPFPASDESGNLPKDESPDSE